MLKAKKNEEIKNFVEDKENIFNLVEKYWSPCHFIFPKSFWKNIDDFKNTLDNLDLRYKIFYAHKSNKTPIFLDVCKEKNIWIDVSSENELQNCIWKNIYEIECSWPKNKHFLKKCLENKNTIAIDSFSEIESILKIKKEKKIFEKTNILIRLCGFKNSKKSRFWIEISEKDKILEILKNNKENLNFLWFSFHIDTESINEKVSAIEEILEISKEFLKYNFRIKILNIWWWFGISYLENKSDWEKYLILLKESFFDENKEISWQNQNYWFQISGKNVIWEWKIYTPFKEKSWKEFLVEILENKLKNFWNIKIKDYLKENFITLWCEPGRALHNFSWVSLAEVISVKNIWKETLVTLNTNSFQLWAREQELFSNPILIQKEESKETKKWFFITWNLCLESDFISKHKIFLWKIPKVWDYLIFINTWWYLMDFYETNSISHDLPKKIIYFSKEENYVI